MLPTQQWDLSTSVMAYVIHADSVVTLAHYGLANTRWGLPTSKLFTVVANGQEISAHTDGLAIQDIVDHRDRPGQRHLTIYLLHTASGLALEHHTLVYEQTALLETWLVVRNDGTTTQCVTRLDSVALDLPADAYTLHSFTGAWGSEFEPHTTALAGDTILESRSGRSSHGQHPWFALSQAGQSILSGAVAWSGNWVIRLNQREDGGYTLSGGLHDWAFATDLAPGQQIEAPIVVLALADGNDLNAISQQYTSVGRTFWYPHNPLADQLPVEWNHWWSYEDKQLDEQTFRENVAIAARLGMDVCTLDAGWFGPTNTETHWYEYRGDWDQINTQRFPSGIRALSDDVHAHGMAFGLWCEIEGLGRQAHLTQTHPHIIATRETTTLGYVCLGSQAGQEWAFATLDRLIREYACDWIKLDFNLDPGAGCDRIDHGHGANDGLYAHYRGYYQLLERVRATHPGVVLENCSSGGLRIDLGIARHTHMAFLSDPDWPEHSLQTFWGASMMLAPDACLHWSYCEWRFAEHRYQHFDPADPALQLHQIDFYTRISMLRRFGFSQRLPNLPNWVAERYQQHIAIYKQHVCRFVGTADLLRLTSQPQREGHGERWPAFQYRLHDGSEHLLAVFRLPGGESARTIFPMLLDPARRYTIIWLGQQREEASSGAMLMTQGMTFTELPEEGSALLLLR